jgi:SAM-dependent methyltransferase
LLNFSYEDESFDYILCWGVLMHIPDLETAISELSRILKRGGVLIISELNMQSWEVRLTQLLRPLFGKAAITTRNTPAGIEAWAETGQGPLMTRRANISWLVKELSERGLSLRERRAGQFTEAYMRVGRSLPTRLIHGFNNWYFEHIGLPGPACGNILLLEKDSP